MSQVKLLKGWDESKIHHVLAHYREQTEEDALVEDESDIESTETVMAVTHDLVPAVRELIAKRQR